MTKRIFTNCTSFLIIGIMVFAIFNINFSTVEASTSGKSEVVYSNDTVVTKKMWLKF